MCTICSLLTGSCVQSFNLRRIEGPHMQSFNPSKDCICDPCNGWRIACNPWKGWRTTWSFEWLKDHMKSSNPSKDHACNPSTLRRTMNMILQPFQGLRTIPQPFEGLQTQSFNHSKDCKRNPSNGWRITYNPSTIRVIAWSFEGLKDCARSFNHSNDRAVLRRITKDCKRNPSTLRRTKQSFEALKDCACNPGWSFNPSKDRTQSFNPSKD